MSKRFKNTEFSIAATMIDKDLIESAADLEHLIEGHIHNGREKSLALTKLEECVMWVRKAMRDIEDED